MCVKVIFLDVVFNDEKNDTLVGSLRAILPDLNVSTTDLCKVFLRIYIVQCVSSELLPFLRLVPIFDRSTGKEMTTNYSFKKKTLKIYLFSRLRSVNTD